MKINIGVFFGGKSVEHEISVISAIQVMKVLEKENYEVIPIYISKDGKWYNGENLLEIDNYKNLKKLLSNSIEINMSSIFGDNFIYKTKTNFLGQNKILTKIDIAFPILHGTYGEDGTIQGFFDLKGISYVGSDLLSSAVGMDKIISKMILKSNEIPVVDFIWFYEKEWYKNKDNFIKKINFPVIIKPANLGSSIGISKAKNLSELTEAIEFAGNFSNKILIEKMIYPLKEINCSVLGDSEKSFTSVLEEPISSGDILSYEDKYFSKGNNNKGITSTKRKIPADIPKEMENKIKNLAKKTFKIFGNSGVVRIDFIIDKKENEVFVNEINTIPGSLSFYLWEATNKKFSELLNNLIEIALKKQREKENLKISYKKNIFNLDPKSLKMGNKN